VFLEKPFSTTRYFRKLSICSFILLHPVLESSHFNITRNKNLKIRKEALNTWRRYHGGRMKNYFILLNGKEVIRKDKKLV